ncbi:MAG TPA: metallophosphoesterase [Bryobacteraceae bacterium]|nr:metallophosphoesterase [Bryobacteraceae bacterium]
MPEFHGEPYVYLAGLTHDSALIAWGAFYFRVKERNGIYKLLDAQDMEPALRETIGRRSTPYGTARVVVRDASGAEAATARVFDANHCWVSGLKPDTEYTYQIFVAPTKKRSAAGTEEEWAKGERWDWAIRDDHANLYPGGHYDNRFRTFPDPAQPASSFSFAVIGDFGVGIRRPSGDDHRQREVADALRIAVHDYDARFLLTTGDNIYAGSRFLWITGSEGDEDDDWFFTYFQPYRYILNRIPVYPCIGNHDTAELESPDDRDQLMDNLYLRERFAGEEKYGRASIGPGLFYRFRFGRDAEFVAIDTSKESFFSERLFEVPKHLDFIQCAFSPIAADAPRWRVPFAHHPPFCAGPLHRNTGSMSRLLPIFEQAGVQAMFCGHEHNFQHSRCRGIDYFITGGAGKVRQGRPSKSGFEDAHTVSWAGTFNFLIVTIDGGRMLVHPLTERDGHPEPLVRFSPAGESISGPAEITLR